MKGEFLAFEGVITRFDPEFELAIGLMPSSRQAVDGGNSLDMLTTMYLTSNEFSSNVFGRKS